MQENLVLCFKPHAMISWFVLLTKYPGWINQEKLDGQAMWNVWGREEVHKI